MALSTNNKITWQEVIDTVLNSIRSVCCNVDSFKSDVPSRLRSGQGQMTVYTRTTGIPSSKSTQNFYYYANPAELISVVTSSTITNEWNTFLAAAGINGRANKVIQAREMGLAVALFTQFMSYHLKPVHSRRQVYNTVEVQSTYQGIKYVTGALTPNYTLSAIDAGNIPVVGDNDIKNIITQTFTTGQFLDNYANPRFSTCSLS